MFIPALLYSTTWGVVKQVECSHKMVFGNFTDIYDSTQTYNPTNDKKFRGLDLTSKDRELLIAISDPIFDVSFITTLNVILAASTKELIKLVA